MKRCPNRNCISSMFFGDDRVRCPICNSTLVDLDSAGGENSTLNDSQNNVVSSGSQNNAVLPSNINVLEEIENANEPEFLVYKRRKVICHGRILEIENNIYFNSVKHRIINSVFRGEPYQFNHQTIECIVRLEQITESYPSQVMDFCLYGNYSGRLQIGDEIRVEAMDKGDRRVVNKVFNITTNSAVRPGPQIPGTYFRAVALVVMIFIIALLFEVASFIMSRYFVKTVSHIMADIFQFIVVVYILRRFIRKGILRRRIR